ncbi:MAG: PhnD/SsuA/transferrin family substrate-binding protein [Hydrogenophilales bacterium]|nr:PhnD/SsuA/transferrin family substrate-binding protein [Hydrogenophilales bacterium]
MKRLLARSLICLTALGLPALPARAAPPIADELYLGSVAMDVPAAMVQRLTPLTAYLTKKTGIKISFRASPNLGSAVNELGKDFTQVAYLTPVAFVEAHDKYRARALVSPLTHGKDTFNLVVAVRQDSPFQTMTDLKGKSFALGDEKALLQRAVVVGGGVKLEEFSKYSFLKHYDNIAKAVLNKDFDAGILKDTSFEKFAPQGLRKIYTSPPLSSYLFAVSERLPAETVKKLRAAFLELKADTPEGKAILKELDPAYDGFVLAEDNDYDTIRKLIAPFQAPAAK